MTADNPRVTVGMPVYNGERYVARAIDSILAQTFTDLELVISDNGSTDQTEAICRTFAAKDRRIRLTRSEQNLGAAWNHNRVFALARGHYFKWNSYDDVLAPTFLEKCVAVLDGDRSVVVAYPQIIDIDENDSYITTKCSPAKSNKPEPHERFGQLISMGYTCEEIYGLMRTDVLRKTPLIGGYSDSDRVLLAEIGLYGPFREVPEPLLLHRIHPENSVGVNPGRHARTAWFDPAAKNRIVFPYWRQLGEYLRSIARTPLPFGEKVRTYATMGRWMADNHRRLRSDLGRVPRLVVRAYFPRARNWWRTLRGAPADNAAN